MISLQNKKYLLKCVALRSVKHSQKPENYNTYMGLNSSKVLFPV